MKSTCQLLLATALALLAGCGGSPGSASPRSLRDATPSYAALSMDQAGTLDTAPAALEVASSPLTIQGTGCEPHLFLRAREVVRRVNRHLYKALRHVEDVLSRTPGVDTAASRTWEATNADGVRVRFTVTELGPSRYAWTLELRPVGEKEFLTVLSGEIDRTGASGAHEGKGSLDIDFARLHQAYPADPARQGTLHLDFETGPSARRLAVTSSDLTWDVEDDLGLGAAAVLALEAPRSDAYLYFREPGLGGSLQVDEQEIFTCPANPDLALASAHLVTRWYRASSGEVQGRTDGSATGGQLRSPVESLAGVTCHAAAAEDVVAGESFWLWKAEDASGATATGDSSEDLGGAPASDCDAAFGPVPVLADSGEDFSVDPAYGPGGAPYPFPGMR